MTSSPLTPYEIYRHNVYQWNTILGLIPKIAHYFGDTDANFHSFTLYLGCTPEVTYKIRLLAHRYGHSSFLHLLHVMFEIAPTLDHFVHTIFDWAKRTNSLRNWIDNLILDKSFPRIFMFYVDLYVGNYA